MAHLGVGGELAVRRERLFARARGKVLEIGDGSSVDLHDPKLEPASYDTVECNLALCSVDDVDATLGRIDDLLAPDGQLLVIEHGRATGLRARFQDAWTPVWRQVARGCRPNRDPIAALRRNGYAVIDCDRFAVQRGVPIVSSCIAAVAVRKTPTGGNTE